MDPTPSDSPTESPKPARTAARRRSTATAKSKVRSSQTSTQAPREPSATTHSPFLSIDAEVLADFQDVASRKVRAIVRDKPLIALGGAFAGGFILGGGWRTRLGRFILLAAGRYVVVEAAERYFSI